MKQLLLSGILSLLLSLPVLGDVVLELSRDTISLDETTELLLRSESRGMFQAPSIPMPDGLTVIGTSQRSQIINGRGEFTQAYTLRASRAGTFNIGPFRMQDGTVLDAQTLTVTPVKAVRATDNLFAIMEASSDSVLIRQNVELTLIIFTSETIGDINLADFPEEGFEIGEWQEIRANSRVLNGVRYQQRKFVNRITPTKAGTLVFDPVFRISVPVRGSPRSMLFGPMSVRTERIQLQEPLVINVTEPPAANRPKGYAGHIGSFTLNAEISPSTIRVGDPITLRVELEGTGSLKQALPPHYESTPDFKVYQPKVVTEDLRRDGLSGRKVLEQVVIPNTPDLTELPLLEFHTYQPELGAYQTLTAGPFPITVTGEQVDSLTEGSITALQDIAEAELLGEDLVFIKSDAGRPRSLKKLTPGVAFGTGAGLPFVLWALGSLWLQRRSTQNQKPSRRRKEQASKKMQLRLGGLEQAEDLWGAIWEALSGTLQDRLDLPPGELSTNDLTACLPDRLEEGLRTELFDWIRRCEQARFAGGTAEDSARLCDEIRQFLPRIDKELSK